METDDRTVTELYDALPEDKVWLPIEVAHAGYRRLLKALEEGCRQHYPNRGRLHCTFCKALARERERIQEAL